MESGKLIARAALGPGREFHIQRLARLASLEPHEIAMLRDSMLPLRQVRAGQEIVVAGAPLILATGWAYRTRILPDGRRQVFGHLVPGDIIERRERADRNRNESIVTALVPTELAEATLTKCEVANGKISRAYRAAAGLEARYFQSQILRLGRLTAIERIVHLLLELGERLEAIGAGTMARFPLPVSQELLADTLGLTTVHINRTLKMLRRDGVLIWEAGHVNIADPNRIAGLVHFDRLCREIPPVMCQYRPANFGRLQLTS